MAKSQRLWPPLKRLLAYGKPWRKSLWLAVGMLWIAAAAEVTGPVLVSYFIDNLVAKHQMPWGIVAGLLVGFVLLQLLAAGLHYFRRCCLTARRLGLCSSCAST